MKIGVEDEEKILFNLVNDFFNQISRKRPHGRFFMEKNTTSALTESKSKEVTVLQRRWNLGGQMCYFENKRAKIASFSNLGGQKCI